MKYPISFQVLKLEDANHPLGDVKPLESPAFSFVQSPLLPKGIMDWDFLNNSTIVLSEMDSAQGNTYKNLAESTTMASGLTVVVLANTATMGLGLLAYFFLVRRSNSMDDEELELLKRFPMYQEQDDYSPVDAQAYGPPPMKWTTWRHFLFDSNEKLGRDAQLYLFFERLMILFVFVCALASSFLIPVYAMNGPTAGLEDAESTLRFNQGVFRTLSSQNLPRESRLQLLQIPVWIFISTAAALLCSTIQAITGEEILYVEWLRRPRRQELGFMDRNKHEAAGWTIFSRGIPDAVKSSEQLHTLFSFLYPGQVLRVELLFRTLLQEANLAGRLRNLHRKLEYFDALSVNNFVSLRPSLLSCCRRSRTKKDIVRELERSIAETEAKLDQARSNPNKGFFGCAFVTFRSSSVAERCVREFPQSLTSKRLSRRFLVKDFVVRSIERMRRVESESSLEENSDSASCDVDLENASLALRSMRSEIAPKAGDIIWSTIGMSLGERIVRDFIVGVVVFVLLTLFTSPIAMLTASRQLLNDIGSAAQDFSFDPLGLLPESNASKTPDQVNEASYSSGSLTDWLLSMVPTFWADQPFVRNLLFLYLPVLLLGLINSIVPSVLRLACIAEGHATRSERELSVFNKTLFYYIMNSVRAIFSFFDNATRHPGEFL